MHLNVRRRPYIARSRGCALIVCSTRAEHPKLLRRQRRTYPSLDVAMGRYMKNNPYLKEESGMCLACRRKFHCALVKQVYTCAWLDMRATARVLLSRGTDEVELWDSSVSAKAQATSNKGREVWLLNTHFDADNSVSSDRGAFSSCVVADRCVLPDRHLLSLRPSHCCQQHCTAVRGGHAFFLSGNHLSGVGVCCG